MVGRIAVVDADDVDRRMDGTTTVRYILILQFLEK